MNPFRVLDYHIPSLQTPRADYQDFKSLQFTELDVRCQLERGVMPPGLLLETDGNVYQVIGAYETRQYLHWEGRCVP